MLASIPETGPATLPRLEMPTLDEYTPRSSHQELEFSELFPPVLKAEVVESSEPCVSKGEPSPAHVLQTESEFNSSENLAQHRITVKQEFVDAGDTIVKVEPSTLSTRTSQRVKDRMAHHDGEYLLNDPFNKICLRGQTGFYSSDKAKQFSEVRTQRSGLTTGKWFWVADEAMQGKFKFRLTDDGSVTGSWGWHEMAEGGGEISGRIVSKCIPPADEKVLDSIELEAQNDRTSPFARSPDSKDKARQLLEMMGRGRRRKKKKRSFYEDDEEDYLPSSHSAPDSEDYTEYFSDELQKAGRFSKLQMNYGDEPPADIKSVSDRKRILYYRRFCELIRVGLVPKQIYPIMESESEDRTRRAKAAYEQEVETEKRKRQQACLNMWMSTAEDSQTPSKPAPSPVKLEKGIPSVAPPTIAPIRRNHAGMLNFSSPPRGFYPQATVGAPVSPSLVVPAQAQANWWMGTQSPLRQFDSPKVTTTIKMEPSPVKLEQRQLDPRSRTGGPLMPITPNGTDAATAVNPYPPSNECTQRPQSELMRTEDISRSIELLDGRKRNRNTKVSHSEL